MTLQEAKEKIIKVVREMDRLDMVNAFEGNVSMRVGDTYLITPSQVDKQLMTTEMIVETDAEMNVLNPECGMKPSSELKMHLQAYKVRPDISAAVHNHSAYATAFAVAGKPIAPLGFAEAMEIFEQIPVVPYGTPGTPEIAAGFEAILPDYTAVLLENHGVLCVGPTLELAFTQARAVEKIAKTMIMAQVLGGEKPIPEDQREPLAKIAQGIKATIRQAGLAMNQKHE